MRPASALPSVLLRALAVVLCLTPAMAQGAVRLHVPHSKPHRGHGAQPAAPAPPVSDIPDPVWASSHTRR